MKTLLITGFEPFGGDAVNPSWEAVRLLPPQIGGWRVQRLRLPVVFGAAAEQAIAEALRLDARAVVSVGLAAGRAAVTPEMVAINLRYGRIPDNAGAQPQDEPVVPGGPAAYFATLPVRAMTAAIARAGIPAQVSTSAGAFVCNDVMYSLLHRFTGTDVRAGFIHVPSAAGRSAPGLPLEDIVSALTAAVREIG